MFVISNSSRTRQISQPSWEADWVLLQLQTEIDKKNINSQYCTRRRSKMWPTCYCQILGLLRSISPSRGHWREEVVTGVRWAILVQHKHLALYVRTAASSVAMQQALTQLVVQKHAHLLGQAEPPWCSLEEGPLLWVHMRSWDLCESWSAVPSSIIYFLMCRGGGFLPLFPKLNDELLCRGEIVKAHRPPPCRPDSSPLSLSPTTAAPSANPGWYAVICVEGVERRAWYATLISFVAKCQSGGVTVFPSWKSHQFVLKAIRVWIY